MNRSYEYHGTDDLVETQVEQLARVMGLDESTVAAALAPEPISGLIRTDAELDRVHERVERGEAAEAELAFRSMVRDIDPTLYAAEVPMLDDERHVMATPKAKLESQLEGFLRELKAAKAAGYREAVAVLERAVREVRAKLASKAYDEVDDDDERAYRQLAADFPGAA